MGKGLSLRFGRGGLVGNTIGDGLIETACYTPLPANIGLLVLAGGASNIPLKRAARPMMRPMGRA